MSVSSHLTPEPERRLWIILENISRAVESTDKKTAALTAFAAAELAFLKLAPSAGPLGLSALILLSAALPLGVFAFSPLTGAANWFPFLEPRLEKPKFGDSMISADVIAKCSLAELIHYLDKYLGGGITATQYYEDIVGEILIGARISARKQRLLRALCVLAGLGQLGVVARLFGF